MWLCMLSLMVSCEKPSGDEPGQQTKPETEDEVKVLSSTNLEFAPEGGSLEVPFTASGSWTAQFISSSPDSWCIANSLSGTKDIRKISLSADGNNTNATRTATFRISSGKANADIAISQYYIEHLTLSQTVFTIGPESQTIEVIVTSNVDVNVVIPTSCSWAHITEETLSSYKFLIEENPTDSVRTAEIRFSGGMTQLSQTVIITQDKNNSADPGLGSDIDIPGFGNEDW